MNIKRMQPRRVIFIVITMQINDQNTRREPVRRAEDAWAEDARAEDLRAEDARAEVS